MAASHGYQILGVGAPIVDQILLVSEEYLKTIPGLKGGMEVVDYPTLTKIIRESGSTPVFIPGGSGANVIRGLANLGRKCALVGKVGNDEIGKHLLHTIRDLGIQPLYIKTPTPTAQVVSLVTPDSQRTLRTYLGACQEMTGKDLDPTHFQDVALVHIEGYALLNEELVQRAMEYAKEAGAKISFDLASFEVAAKFRDTVVDLLWKYVDIVFANIDETKTLTDMGPAKGCSMLKDLCDVAVVSMGKEGCWVGHGEHMLRCPAYPVEPIDTTGAGDFFASGFLHGYLEGKPLEVCAHYGALAGAAVVQVLGADLTPEMWIELRKKIS